MSKDELPAGMYRLSWDLRYTGATTFAGIVLEGGNPARGPWAAPGTYRAKLTLGEKVAIQEFVIQKDPRLREVSNEDLEEQFLLAMKIRDCESAANEAVIEYRRLSTELERKLEQSSDRKLHKAASAFLADYQSMAAGLYQLKNQSPKDKIANPIRLNDRLTGLRSHLEAGDMKPTASYYAVYEELSAELEARLSALTGLLEQNLPIINQGLTKLKLQALSPKHPKHPKHPKP